MLNSYLRDLETNAPRMNVLQARADEMNAVARRMASMAEQAARPLAQVAGWQKSLEESAQERHAWLEDVSTRLRRFDDAVKAAMDLPRLRQLSTDFGFHAGWQSKLIEILKPVRALDSLVGNQFKEIIENSRRMHEAFDRNVFFVNLRTILDDDTSGDEKMVAIDLLLDAIFPFPVAFKRWTAHKRRIESALQERAATHRTSIKEAQRMVFREAVFTVCAELKKPRANATIRHGRKRLKVENLMALEDLAVTELQRYVQNLLGTEVMNILVPEWRDLEIKEKRPLFRAAPIQDHPELESDEVRPYISSENARLSVNTLLRRARLPQEQEMLVRLILEEDLSAASAGVRLGKGDVWGRVTYGRIVEKLKKIS